MSDASNPLSGATSFTAGGYPTKFIFNPGKLGDYRFEIGSTEVLRIADDGNVGIGTPSPMVALHVEHPATEIRLQDADSAATDPSFSAVVRFMDNTGEQVGYLGDGTAGGKQFEVLAGPGYPLTFGTDGVDNRMIIDLNGRVGIGTTDPTATLSVGGAIAAGVGVGTGNLTGGSNNNILVHGRSTQSNTTAGIQLGDDDNTDSRQFAILNGHDGISQAAGVLFFVSSDVVNTDPLSGDRLVLMQLDTYPNPGIVVHGKALKPGGGSWGDYSDVRLKQNIIPLSSSLSRLLRLRGVTFEWRAPEKHGNLRGPQIGMIAQEVEQVFPEWVGEDRDGFKTLTYRGFEALTVESFRELKTENDTLKDRLTALEERAGVAHAGFSIDLRTLSAAAIGAAAALGVTALRRRRKPNSAAAHPG